MSEQTTPWPVRVHPVLEKKVDAYIKKNKAELDVRRLGNRTALINWSLLEIVEGRSNPCRKS